jgi:hypothetical protein
MTVDLIPKMFHPGELYCPFVIQSRNVAAACSLTRETARETAKEIDRTEKQTWRGIWNWQVTGRRLAKLALLTGVASSSEM